MSIRRHTIYNLAGAAAPPLVMLITLPPYLRLIGEARYGILAIVFVLLGYFGLFDLGLSRATAQRIAALRDAAPEERADTFWTALVLNSVFGLTGALVLWALGLIVFQHYFQMSEGLRAETLVALPWMAATVPVATISGVLVGTLQGRERFLELNVVNTLGTILLQVLPLTVAWLYGPHLGYLLPATLLARVATFALSFEQCRRFVPLLNPPAVRRRLVLPLLKYGGWVTVSSVVGPLMHTFDRVLIGSVIGAAAVSYYSVPFSLTQRLTTLAESLSGALFPRFSAEENQDASDLFGRALVALAFVLTPLVVTTLSAVWPFLDWWLGGDFARRSSAVAQVLVLGVWANSFARIAFEYVQAQGRPAVIAKIHMAELLPYGAVLYVASTQWGLVGVATAWSLRAAVDALLMFHVAGGLRRVLTVNRIPMALMAATAIALWFLERSPAMHVVVLTLWTGSLVWAWLTAPEWARALLRKVLAKARLAVRAATARR